MPQNYPLADLALSRRLERAEALANARFVEARAKLFPGSGAAWIEIAGARAMYDGAASPLTQTFGLGLFQNATAADLDAIEAFYAERGAPVFHEISPLADEGLWPLLAARGYRPFEFSSVLYQPIASAGLMPCATGDKEAIGAGDAAAHRKVAQRLRPAIPVVRLIEKGEEETYARTSAAGWAEFGVGEFLLEIGRVSASVEGLRVFLVELEGRPIAAGALNLSDGIALLAGASTIPDARKRGAQLALLDYRLRYAAANGSDVAMMAALPGSGSQRNAERNGFRIAYTRIKWRR